MATKIKNKKKVKMGRPFGEPTRHTKIYAVDLEILHALVLPGVKTTSAEKIRHLLKAHKEASKKRK